MAIAYVDFQNLPPNACSVLFKAGAAVNSTSGQVVTVVADENMRGTIKPIENLTENKEVENSWTDKRDGQVYKTVKIGEQIWLAENFRFATPAALDTKNPLHGIFYSWEQAIAACPEGWHLPSKAEWEKLVEISGGRYELGNFLKSADGWYNNQGGKKSNGFNAYPAGEYREMDKSFWHVNYYTSFWTADDLSKANTYKGDSLAYYVKLSYLNNQLLMDNNHKEKFFCVRYIKNEA